MASTNKTTNYNLSQYIGTDKPTYLGDYNGDMQKIDARMKTNADGFASAQSLAQTAKDTADLAETHAQTGITNAGTAQSTASSALAKATQNEANIANFNLSIFETVDNSDIVCPDGTLNTSTSSITVAKNSDGSLAKIYGTVNISLSNHTGTVRVSFPTSLRPSQAITIQNSNVRRFITNANANKIAVNYLTINPNGIVELQASSSVTEDIICNYYLLPCLYWIKDFGDAPIPESKTFRKKLLKNY